MIEKNVLDITGTFFNLNFMINWMKSIKFASTFVLEFADENENDRTSYHVYPLQQFPS